MDVIAQVRKERGKMLLVLDTGERVSVPLSVFRERPFSEGDTVDMEEYDQWLMVRQYRYALQRAVGYLAQRPHSSHEIEEKLLRTGYRPCTVEMVLYKLEKEKLLNDRDFAEQWAAYRARQGLGKSRIAQELRRKGIDSGDTGEILEQVDEEEQLNAAVRAAEAGLRRSKKDEDIRKTSARLMGLLVRRGFEYPLARRAIERVLKRDIEGEEE